MDALLDSSLVYFAEVASSGSVSAAAKRLHLSQPSVSVALKRLEERIGASLFHRHARGVTLTPAGKLLLGRTREAAAALRAARDEVDALHTEARGRYQLGCHESLGAYFLPGFMGRMLRDHAKVELSLHNANSREVEQAVVERAVDLGLVVNPAGHPDCVVRPLFTDRVGFLVARKLARRSRPRLALLESRPLFLVPSLRQTQVLLANLLTSEVSVTRSVECSSMELVKSLVLDGAGVGILPYRVASHGVAKGRLQPLARALPSFDDHIALVWRADAPMTAGLRVVIDALLAHGRAMPALPDMLR